MRKLAGLLNFRKILHKCIVKREVNLMNTKNFPRASLDMQIDNPDVKNSVIVKPVEKTDK